MRRLKFTTLQWALVLSVVGHAALLIMRGAEAQPVKPMVAEMPLQVILVNAATNEKPDKAKAIAQKSLAGGGDLDKGRATSPLPPSMFTAKGDSIEETQRQVDAMQEQQMIMLTTLRKQISSMPIPDPNQVGNPAEAAAQEEKRRRLINLLAEIEQRVNEENARPKKRYISPATREAAYALYVDALRERVERRGTENFPQVAGSKLYGELMMMITINFDGTLAAVEIAESSGNIALDSRARAIVASSGNFGRFTEPMRREADQIVLASRFKFTREETLETQLATQ